MTIKYSLPGIAIAICVFGMMVACAPKLSEEIGSKIEFDFRHIDGRGLYKGEKAIDYEFCIPADSTRLKEIMRIAPDVKVYPDSKGRIRCSKQEWLCIHSTQYPDWQGKLHSIASLHWINRIIETHYE